MLVKIFYSFKNSKLKFKYNLNLEISLLKIVIKSLRFENKNIENRHNLFIIFKFSNLCKLLLREFFSFKVELNLTRKTYY